MKVQTTTATAKEKTVKVEDTSTAPPPFSGLDIPRCPLCKYPLILRMTKQGPGCPCPCQQPFEDFAPLGDSFVMPPGTPGAQQVMRLKRRGIMK